MDDAAILEAFEQIALEAGRAIMRICADGIKVETKTDQSPVTRADRESEKIILAGLAKLLPGVPVVAEEQASAGEIPMQPGAMFLLVDPLDGTREFVGGHDDYTVNIALVRDGKPEIGVVYAPAQHGLFSGRPGAAFGCKTSEDHKIVSRKPIKAKARSMPCKVLASRSHRTPETDAYLAELGRSRIMAMGSSLKFCLIAAGKADLYPRFGPTMQWDTAAGDAVLRAAGGKTCKRDGAPLVYGPGEGEGVAAYRNPDFIAAGNFEKLN